MVMSLPRLRRPKREDLPKRSGVLRRSDLPDARGLIDRIKLPDLSDLPDRAELAERIKLPELPDRAELAQRVKMPDLSNIDLSNLPRRFPWRRRRAVDRAAGLPRVAITMLAIALAGIAGAVAAYFLDPDRGKDRRIEAANRLAGLGRRVRGGVDRIVRYTTSTVGAVGQRISNRTTDYEPPNDAALAAKVESKLFSDPSIEKGRLNVNVENGVVILRGVADSAEQIASIIAATESIPGVRTVRSLLRTPDEPAMNETGQPELAPSNSSNSGL